MQGATNTVKVLVLGPHGHETAAVLRALAHVRVLAVDRVPLLQRAEHPAVALHFGRVELTSGLAISMITASDAESLRTHWGVLSDGLLGAIVVVDGRDPVGLDRARVLVAQVRELGLDNVVVGRGDAGTPDAPESDALRDAVALPGADVVDLRPGHVGDARDAVLALLHATLRRSSHLPTRADVT